ncbi:MAG: class I SAM-dependent rRNA methyltransferase [Opitutaceae bacterium]|nr:class I SAM-dependent rRNA methyltransferase [Opitutaceae bacterium]
MSTEPATSPAACLKLKPNAKARAARGHPWVFANEVEALLPPAFDGEVVECRDRTGRRIGSGIYNSRSQICWRKLARERVELDEAFLRGAIGRALARRGGAETGRLVWSEADGLPGVVVDRFGDTLVLQIQTLAMERRRDLIARLLAEAAGAAEVIFRDDAPIRRLEGLETRAGATLSGRDWEPRVVGIDGIEYLPDLQNGQKTGFYLDQREQHAAVARRAAGRRVLDAFCNQGAFALHCAKAGAASVLGVDSAADAVAAARGNAARNGLAAEFLEANVFDFLNAPERREERWDLIVLDPPPFAKSRGALEGAMRGYRELNLRAMQHLAPGGLLATYACSHHVRDAELRQVVAEAAADARRLVHILEFCHQPPDHPVLATMPESEYLRGYVLRVE